MATKDIKLVKPDESEDLFEHKEITLRGTTYRLRELEGAVYDECVEMATSDTDDQGRRMTDWGMVNKFVLERSLVEPKMNQRELNALPYAVRQSLFIISGDLHPAFPKEARPEEAKNGKSASERRASSEAK